MQSVTPQKIDDSGPIKLDYAPTKLEGEEAKQLDKKPDSFTQAGVWDHKALDHQEVKDYVEWYVDQKVNESKDFPIMLFSCNTFSGQTTTLISRGKAKLGFSYSNILWEWRGKRGTWLHGAEGVMNFYDVNDVDQDEFTTSCEMLTGKDKFNQKEVEAEVKKYLDQIVRIHIEAFFKLKPKKKT